MLGNSQKDSKGIPFPNLSLGSTKTLRPRTPLFHAAINQMLRRDGIKGSQTSFRNLVPSHAQAWMITAKRSSLPGYAVLPK